MPECPNCKRTLIEDSTFCPGCSLENPLEQQNVKKKTSLKLPSLFYSAFFWVWAVPLWVILWFISGMFISSGILSVLVLVRTVMELINSQREIDY